eukprot:CAMPEP_0182420440 /NCGR_PEP_ID=MMETSP1167-20130531/5233_1 /TAXON_ID=2988 /ORGANISM="Mallomonas Sp, Strain CCMP3275" /LENGTH=435 /DNA_ID=CAMNT_0024596377 /DNA_START=245 /DNA_END=1552 /DNA_ORIENTATION=+
MKYTRSVPSMASSWSETRPREFRHLRPLPCVGTYEPDEDVCVSSVFLGPERMSIKKGINGQIIAKGLVPIPIREDIESGLVAAMKPDDRAEIFKSWSAASITDRDGGFFDNLSPILKWAPKPNARKNIYEYLRLKGSSSSPYHAVLSALDLHASLQITGLLVEVADRPSPYSLSLGGAMLVCRSECAGDWKLSSSRIRLIKDCRASEEARLINCAMDELVGIALATKLPIIISDSLYSSVCVDGFMEKLSQVTVSAPAFSTIQEEQMWRKQTRDQRNQEEGKILTKMTRKADEIPDASSYLYMTVKEKRACLRATGVTTLPRPREGVQAVDALLIPLLDEEVAYEVLRRLAETKGDFQEAAEMEDYESRKPAIARRIKAARDIGDMKTAKKLCDELNSLSVLKFDPTVVDGVEGEWDVEEWYWEQRKRVYGIIAA